MDAFDSNETRSIIEFGADCISSKQLRIPSRRAQCKRVRITENTHLDLGCDSLKALSFVAEVVENSCPGRIYINPNNSITFSSPRSLFYFAFTYHLHIINKRTSGQILIKTALNTRRPSNEKSPFAFRVCQPRENNCRRFNVLKINDGNKWKMQIDRTNLVRAE